MSERDNSQKVKELGRAECGTMSPMPLPPPVMRTTRPSTLNSLRGSKLEVMLGGEESVTEYRGTTVYTETKLIVKKRHCVYLEVPPADGRTSLDAIDGNDRIRKVECRMSRAGATESA